MQLYKGATLCPIFGLFLWNRQNKWEIGGQECKIGKRNKMGRINDIGMFKIGYTKRSHAVVLKELCCTQFF